jgi:hypothetical protein
MPKSLPKKPGSNPTPPPPPAFESVQGSLTPFPVAKWQFTLQPQAPIRPKAVGQAAALDYFKTNNNQTKFGLYYPLDTNSSSIPNNVDPSQAAYHGIDPVYFNRTVTGTSQPYYQTFPAGVSTTQGLSNPAAYDEWYSLDIAPGTANMVKKVVTTVTGSQQLADVATPIIGYADGVANGQVAQPTIPGAFFKGRVGRGTVVRVNNKSFTAANPQGEWFSNHLHGGHTGSFSDGYATFVTDPGKYRDFFYPNTVPYASIDLDKNGKFDDPDFGESPSSMWYHDHGIDLTDKHVLQGAYAAYATFDEIELNQVRSNLLPGWDFSLGAFDENKFMSQATKYDQYLVLSDLAFNADGSIRFDPNDHDGTLGDHVAVNGKVYPVMEVEPTKYRFRILDGSNARFYHLQLEDAIGNNPKFTGVGIDTWQFERAMEHQSLWLSPAKRHDVVVDFSKYKDGDVVYLENILAQQDGRGPDGEPSDPRPTAGDKILKFVVKGAPKRPNEIPTIKPGDFLRDHHPIDASQVSGVRELEFIRQNGVWKINQIDYDPTVALSTPTTGVVEKWILRNNSGGWAHPMHIHLESHLGQRIEVPLIPLFSGPIRLLRYLCASELLLVHTWSIAISWPTRIT